MNERATQAGDGELATCHVCDAKLPTQEDLLVHLKEEHPDDLLTEGSG